MTPYFNGLDERKITEETRAFYVNPIQNGCSLNISEPGSKPWQIYC